jgi:Predicted membrane GTPase involved in stress response
VGENSRDGDLVLNVTKSKKLTNMRASGSDDKVRLARPSGLALKKRWNISKKTNMLK